MAVTRKDTLAFLKAMQSQWAGKLSPFDWEQIEVEEVRDALGVVIRAVHEHGDDVEQRIRTTYTPLYTVKIDRGFWYTLKDEGTGEIYDVPGSVFSGKHMDEGDVVSLEGHLVKRTSGAATKESA
jgi:hypothetical protein